MNAPIILTVTQLNTYAKSVIEQDLNLNNVFVIGEISNFVDHYRSGHLYMSIKDNQSVISAVMFSGNASKLKFQPQNGMSVIIRGRVSIYERDGKFQLYIDDMQPDGVGALSLAFEQLKEKLLKAGLFNKENKKSIPEYPKKIGVISSPTGAAVQDILNVLERRFPLAEVIFAGVQVQGETAAGSLCKAVIDMNKTDADVIIIARGGGSMEDLWPFNDENLAYAIYNSHIPIISGVGHETDFTICDFVADLRAPTPSAAAELATPDINEQLYYISSLYNTLNLSVNNLITDLEYDFNQLVKVPEFSNPLNIIDNCEMYLDTLNQNIYESINKTVVNKSYEFIKFCSVLDTLSPLKVLSRGYAIVKQKDKILCSSTQAKAGDLVNIKLFNGVINAQITEVLE